jgi:hypothetical protein
MTKNKIKQIARLYAATSVYNLPGMFGTHSEILTNEENAQLGTELKKIAERMTNEPLNFGELDQIIKYIAES